MKMTFLPFCLLKNISKLVRTNLAKKNQDILINTASRNPYNPSENILKDNCKIVQTDRGGDVTYHGPGQLVGYPIIDLKKVGLGIKSYVKNIESLLIATLHDYAIDAHTKEGKPGVWVHNKKIGSIGIRVSHGVTTHGFSLNVNTDMNYFSNIISCGIDDVLMTSMEKELGTKFFMNDIKQSIILHFNQLFKTS